LSAAPQSITKQQFLASTWSVIYHRYRVTVIGSVPIKMQFAIRRNEIRKIAFLFARRNRQINIAQKAAQKVRPRMDG